MLAELVPIPRHNMPERPEPIGASTGLDLAHIPLNRREEDQLGIEKAVGIGQDVVGDLEPRAIQGGIADVADTTRSGIGLA